MRFLILIVIIASSKAFEWRCRYEPNESFTNVGSRLYSCVKPSDYEMTETCVTVDSASDNHFIRKSHQDVLGFWYETKSKASSNLECFPRGFASVFPNILAIGFYHTKIREISKDDLKEFGGRLKYLRIGKSKVEKIDADTFMYNYNIQTIGLDRNFIASIDYSAFTQLSKLKSLWLLGNLCIDESAGNRLDVIKLISEIKEKIKCVKKEEK